MAAQRTYNNDLIAGTDPGFCYRGGVEGLGVLVFENISGGRVFFLVLHFISFSKTVRGELHHHPPSQGALFHS
jgi:hypothetical protein